MAILAPVRLQQGNITVVIDTNYPFGDNATITIENSNLQPVPLHVRIPAWATNATISIAGEDSAVANGTLYTVRCAAQSNVTLILELNPTIRVETGWGLPTRVEVGDNNTVMPATAAAAVLRGPLLYTIPLQQIDTVVKTWAPFNLTDLAMVTHTPWNYALDLDTPMEFLPTSKGVNEELPFNTSNYFAVIRVAVRDLPGWVERHNGADEPPPSPVNCSSIEGGCGARVFVNMVPYGSTNLRMAGLPWITPPATTK